jgi:hypothetical protein
MYRGQVWYKLLWNIGNKTLPQEYFKNFQSFGMDGVCVWVARAGRTQSLEVGRGQDIKNLVCYAKQFELYPECCDWEL